MSLPLPSSPLRPRFGPFGQLLGYERQPLHHRPAPAAADVGSAVASGPAGPAAVVRDAIVAGESGQVLAYACAPVGGGASFYVPAFALEAAPTGWRWHGSAAPWASGASSDWASACEAAAQEGAEVGFEDGEFWVFEEFPAPEEGELR